MQTEYKKEAISKALKDIWGFNSFRDHQEPAIKSIFENRDSLTVLPTGGGKSLCYQLPAVLMPGMAIVVSPLISLMEDQVNALQLLGIPAAFLNSSLNVESVKRIKSQMFRGQLKLLYVSPERLLLDHFKQELQEVAISFFAIDEAHCISQWGHDFRPEYSGLSQIRKLFPSHSIHAFTATAPPMVRNEIVGLLNLNNPDIEIGNYHRPNLYYRVLKRNRLNQQILSLLKDHHPSDLGIIYCLTRKNTEQISEFLNKEGYATKPYHAGLNNQTRKEHQALFAQEKVQIMVATIAFGMGIDQSNVRFVIHTGLPQSLAHYQQESGRAGRDGLPSRCTLIYSGQDIHFWKRMLAQEGATEAKASQFQAMISYAQSIQCRHKSLIEYFGQEFSKPNCQGCDVCLGEIETVADSRTIGRKILSAILRTEQRFGAGYVAQVLTASKDQKVIQNNHDKLSVYGLLKTFSKNQVHDWIGQMENQGYILRQGEPYPTLAVPERGYWLLKPEKFSKTEKDLPIGLVETRRKEKQTNSSKDEITGYDKDLFEKLRQKRAALAQKLNVPAFIVFGDKSLQDMAYQKPTNSQQFMQIYGVGTNKLERFGNAMIQVIEEHINAQSD